MKPSTLPFSTPRYAPFLRHAHWATVVLVALAYLAINARKWFERGTPERLFAVQSHFLLGMLVLLLTVPRIVARLRHRAPPVTPPLGLAARMAAGFAHLLLFGFLVVMPVLGIAARMLSGKGIGLPGTTWTLPAIGPVNEDLAATIMDVHAFIGEAFYYVIAAHVLAALWHWLVRRDDVLQRML